MGGCKLPLARSCHKSLVVENAGDNQNQTWIVYYGGYVEKDIQICGDFFYFIVETS
jgi:hypothetical protein